MNVYSQILLLAVVIFAAAAKANPTNIPELTLINTNSDNETPESQLNMIELEHQHKKDSDFDDDVDSMDEEEFMMPQNPSAVSRRKRAIAFRPKFVYDHQMEREAQARSDRALRRADDGHHDRQGHGGHEHILRHKCTNSREHRLLREYDQLPHHLY